MLLLLLWTVIKVSPAILAGDDLVMQAGQRVAVVDLVGRSDLNGQQGKTIGLVPSTGRYGVELDSGEKISAKIANLSAQYDEVDSGDMITVYGLCYCAAHRLECCGTCFTSYNMLNRRAELPFHLNSYERTKQAEALCDADAQRNQPPRNAPLRPGQVQPPRPGKVEKDQRIKAGLDPSRLLKWKPNAKIARAFLANITMEEKMKSSAPTPGANVSYDVRETLAILAERCDVPGDRERTRFVIQPKSQAQSLAIDVIDVVESDAPDFLSRQVGEREPAPILVVRYLYGTASNVRASHEAMQAGIKLLPPNAQFHSMTVDEAEITVLRHMLDANAKLLDETYVARTGRKLPIGWFVSALQPILSLRETSDHGGCPVCGAKATRACSRCMMQHYCSRECQKSHWKEHKKRCKAPETVENADIIDVDLRIDPHVGLFGLSYMTDTPVNTAKRLERLKLTGHVGSSQPEQKLFVIKVQTPVVSEEAMLCYDSSRSLEVMITDEKCSQKRRFLEMIRARGLVGKVDNGSRKAYFNAYREGETMKILAHEMLPVQTW